MRMKEIKINWSQGSQILHAFLLFLEVIPTTFLSIEIFNWFGQQKHHLLQFSLGLLSFKIPQD